MAVDRIPNEISSEADVSMILNTLLYVDDFQGVNKEMTVSSLLNDMGTRYWSYSDEQRASYNAVYKYIYNKEPVIQQNSDGKNIVESISATESKHPEVSSLIYLNHSVNTRGEKDGAVGATFYSKDSQGQVKDLYVSFRGTGDGRWYDNGDAFSKTSSQYQRDAAEYFDSVTNKLRVTNKANVYVTGHSKGGNQAQYITLASSNAYLIDKCISMDGEGFSPEAIAHFKEVYGEEEYQKRIAKMYSICGDNDYVNVLGIKVIPEGHTVYVESPTDVYDLANGHGLVNTKTGVGNLFDYENGRFYNQTTKQRDLAITAKGISENIMKLPPEKREDVCRSFMTILEFAFNQAPGLNGEFASPEEFLGFLSYSDDIFRDILYTWDGQKFVNRSIYDALKKYVFQVKNGEEASVLVDIICNIGAFSVQVGIEPLLFAIEGFVEIIARNAEFADVLVNVVEFCVGVAKSMGKFFKENFDKNYKAAKEYLGSNSTLFFDTGALHSLAERLWAVNGRLQTLDGRLDGLYRTAKWTDLGKIIKVQSADMKIGWSNRVNNCANCLNDIANRFEKAESDILSLLGE